MSKVSRKIIRSMARKLQEGKAQMASDDELQAKLAGSEEIMRLYKTKDGKFLSMGAPLSRDDAKLAAYFVVERYAQYLDMSVPEFVMNMMRKYNNEESDGA